MHLPRTPHPTSTRAGFAIFEVLLASAILSIALLAQAAGVSSGRRLASSVEERGLAVGVLSKFLERLRADPDWGGLYSRLKPLSRESEADASCAWLRADTELQTYPVSTYYPDFVTPATLGRVTVLVQVPRALGAGTTYLRETMSASRYGLPADLNGDGAIDDDPRDEDYRALPIVVRVRWERPGQEPLEVVLSTWLRGER